MKTKTVASLAGVAIVAVLVAAPLPACDDGGGGGGSGENAGSSCAAPTDCYPNVDGGALNGAVQCLTRVPGGYCTHLCQSDADCCAVPGECVGNFRQHPLGRYERTE